MDKVKKPFEGGPSPIDVGVLKKERWGVSLKSRNEA